MASRDFYRDIRDREAMASMNTAREAAAKTPWWHVSPTGEIREATGMDRIPFDWVGFPDKAKAEKVAADRKAQAAMYPQLYRRS